MGSPGLTCSVHYSSRLGPAWNCEDFPGFPNRNDVWPQKGKLDSIYRYNFVVYGRTRFLCKACTKGKLSFTNYPSKRRHSLTRSNAPLLKRIAREKGTLVNKKLIWLSGPPGGRVVPSFWKEKGESLTQKYWLSAVCPLSNLFRAYWQEPDEKSTFRVSS